MQTPTTNNEKFFTRPLIIIFVTMFIDLIGFGVAIPVLPDYAKNVFGASPFVIGWLVASYSIMQFISTPVLGHLSDKYGRRPILFISLLGTSAAALITGLSHTLALLFFGRIFDGVTGGNISTAQAYIADVTTLKNRAKGMSLIGVAFGLGFILGPAIGGILSRYGTHTPFFFVSALAFTNAVSLYFFLPESIKRSDAVEEGPRRNRLVELFLSLREPRFGTLVAIYFFLVVSFSIMTYAFVLYTIQSFGYTAEQNGYIFAFIGVLAVIFQGGLFNKLVVRFGENPLIIAGCLMMTASLFAIPFISGDFGGLGALLLTMTVLTIGNSMASPALTSLVSKNANESAQGKSLGVMQSGASLARASDDVHHAQIDNFTIHRTFWTASAFMIIAALIAVYFAGAKHNRAIGEEF